MSVIEICSERIVSVEKCIVPAATIGRRRADKIVATEHASRHRDMMLHVWYFFSESITDFRFTRDQPAVRTAYSKLQL